MANLEKPQSGEQKITASSPEQSVNTSRRRLSKGLLAAPVVVSSLAARPALACSVSGFLSGNQSPSHTYTCQGYGCSPGFWKEHPELWTKLTNGKITGGHLETKTVTLKNGKTKIESCWISDGTTLASLLAWHTDAFNVFGVDSSKSLLDLMNQNPGSPIFHFVGAYLNAASAPNAYGATTDEVVAGQMKAYPDRMTAYKDLLEGLEDKNGRACMFNAHGDCNTTPPSDPRYMQLPLAYVDSVQQCMPQCPAGTTFNPDTMTCVTSTNP